MQSRLDAMTSGLALTQDQVTQITQIMNDFLQKRRQLKQQGDGAQDQIIDARKAMKQSVENVFTADQKAKYQTNKAQYWQVQENSSDDNADEKDAQ